MKASPSSPAARIEGVDTYEWLPGGFFLMHKIDARVGDEEIKGIEIIGYDASSQTYPTRSFDNKGNTGAYQASVRDGVWTFRGEAERFTGSFSDGGDTLTGAWERSSDGSKWLPWMHVILTKSA